MVFLRLSRNARVNIPLRTRNVVRKYGTPAVSQEPVEAEGPKYPPILDLSFDAQRKRKAEEWHTAVKNLESVEEKLFKLNMPRYYGFKSYIFHEDNVRYNSVPQAQYITRTHLFDKPGLPEYYDSLFAPEKLDALVQSIKNQVEDAIIFEYSSRRREHELDRNTKNSPSDMENIIADAVMQQVNRILLTNLSREYSHLMELETDHKPRIEACWVAGGMPPLSLTRFHKSRMSWLKHLADEPENRMIQYLGNPTMQLRHNLPLKEFLPHSESENADLEVPTFKYDPRVLGYMVERRHITTIPGFWPGNPNEFGFLSYHNRGHMLVRPETIKYGDEAIKQQALLASYSWLLGQACYQGFSTYNDVTYPLTSQLIISNGQTWSFSSYQLNTTLVHTEHADTNPKRNFCWVTEPLKLFDTIEGEKMYGFNVEVLKHLIKFYANKPEPRHGVEMKPYLGKDVKVIADIEHDERREWLEKHYKHLVANRPRHRLVPEIYDWQRIFLIRFKSRPLDKKREPFEFGRNPFLRKLDEHAKPYVPKALRPEKKNKRLHKFAKTYYP